MTRPRDEALAESPDTRPITAGTVSILLAWAARLAHIVVVVAAVGGLAIIAGAPFGGVAAVIWFCGLVAFLVTEVATPSAYPSAPKTETAIASLASVPFVLVGLMIMTADAGAMPYFALIVVIAAGGVMPWLIADLAGWNTELPQAI